MKRYGNQRLLYYSVVVWKGGKGVLISNERIVYLSAFPVYLYKFGRELSRGLFTRCSLSVLVRMQPSIAPLFTLQTEWNKNYTF